MPNAIGSVIIDIRSDMSSLVKTTEKAQVYMKKQQKSFNRTVGTMGTALVGLASGYAAVTAAAKAFQVASDFTKTAAEFEKFNTVLTTIEGSATQADASMQWIEEFTKTTPFQLAQVTESFIKLRAYGLEPTEGLLETLGDTASAMGKDVIQAVEAISDAVVGENERLKEFGIKASKAGEKITYNWVNASGEARTKVIQNNQDIIQSTLEAIFNSRYEGAMEAQSKTWNGLISNIQDNWTIFQKNMMNEGLLDYMKAIATVAGKYIADGFDMAGDSAANFSKYVIDMSRDFILSMGSMYDSLETFGAYWNVVGNLADIAITGVAIVLNAIPTGFIKAFESVIDTLNFFIEKTINPLIAGLNKIYSGLEALGASHFEIPALDFGNIDLGGDALQENLNVLVEHIVDAGDDLNDAWADLLDTGAGSRFAQKFVEDIDTEFKKISSNFTTAVEKTDFGDVPKEALKDLKLISKEIDKIGKDLKHAGAAGLFEDTETSKALDKFNEDLAEGFAHALADAITSGDVSSAINALAGSLGSSLGGIVSAEMKASGLSAFASSLGGAVTTIGVSAYATMYTTAISAAFEEPITLWTKQTNILEEIAESSKATSDSLTFLASVGVNSGYSEKSLTAKTFDPYSSHGSIGVGDAAIGEAIGYAILNTYTLGIGSALAKYQHDDTLTISNNNAALESVVFSEVDSVYNEAVEAVGTLVTGWFSGMDGATDKVNLLVEEIVEGKSKSNLLHSDTVWEETTLIFEEVTKATAMGMSILAQYETVTRDMINDPALDFDSDQFGQLTQAGLSAFTSAWEQLGDTFDSLEDIQAVANGADQDTVDLNRVNLDIEEMIGVMETLYGIDLSGLTLGNIADTFNLETLAEIAISTGFTIDQLTGNISGLADTMLIAADATAKAETAQQKVIDDQRRAQQAVARAEANRIATERLSLEDQLARVGLDNLQLRELDILKIDESNRSIQREIWLREDNIKALEEEAKAAEEAAETNRQNIEEAVENWVGVQIDGINATMDAEKEKQDILEDNLKAIQNDISTLEGVFDSLGDVIAKLRGEALGTSYTLDGYNKSMAESLSLYNSGDYEAFAESIANTIGGVGILSDSSLYQTAADQKFAQLVAANQFETMEDYTETEIDYLKQIEINTREQIGAILSLLEVLGKDIKELEKVLDPKEGGAFASETAYIESLYNQYGQTMDAAGLEYWLGDVVAGQSAADIAKSFETAFGGSSAPSTPSAPSAPAPLSAVDTTGWTPTQEYDYGMNNGFANGGFTGNSMGVVHPNEFVINAEQTKNLGINNSSATGVFGVMSEQLTQMNVRLANIEKTNSDTADNTERTARSA